MKLDIAVAGCGIGGLAAALLLQRDGHRVVMFERFERARAVGSGLMLQPTGLAVLDRLGLGQAVRHSGARIDRLFGRVGGGRDSERHGTGRTVLDVRYAALGPMRVTASASTGPVCSRRCTTPHWRRRSRSSPAGRSAAVTSRVRSGGLNSTAAAVRARST